MIKYLSGVLRGYNQNKLIWSYELTTGAENRLYNCTEQLNEIDINDFECNYSTEFENSAFFDLNEKVICQG